MAKFISLAAVVFASFAGAAPAAERVPYASHPPTRPLPTAARNPFRDVDALHVDPVSGNDSQDGSKEKPWKTLGFALSKLQPGRTLYLRSGIYRGHWSLGGVRNVSIRSYPGELAILDGGLADFYDDPGTAWEVCAGGVEGEFWSKKTYPDLGGQADNTNVLGNFADSMVPLHGYRLRGDLQSDNPYWNVSNKVGDKEFVYCGPGIYYDVTTGRIHCRLAHTKLPGLHENNYRGETDPRKLKLIIGGHAGGHVVELNDCDGVQIRDLVIRGARDATLAVVNCRDVTLEGLTVYGGSAPIQVRDSHRLRVLHTACRGLAAPWTFRGSLKYRAIESRLFSASGWEPTGTDSTDFEIAYSEFTDSVDGVFLGNVRGVSFHHNLVGNVSDDGVFLTAATAYDCTTHGGDVHIYQNRLARCLTTFAFGVGHGRQKMTASGKQVGAGVYVYRNVFDFRRPVMYYWPTGPDAPQEITSLGRIAGDHGSPAWEPMWIYHNTILAGDVPRYDYGTDGLGKAIVPGTKRRVLNNIICQLQGMVGQTLPPPTADFQADGNLFWSISDGPQFAGELFAKFRTSADFAASKTQYEPGWTASDQFADPRFERWESDWRKVPDLRLTKGSPAIDSGIVLPEKYADVSGLPKQDAGAPDRGAIPAGGSPWPVGIRGRLNVDGAEAASDPEVVALPSPRWSSSPPPMYEGEPVLLIQGYPAFDAPLVEFALRKRGVLVEVVERTWLPAEKFAAYGLVVYDGSLARAKISPTQFSPEDLRALHAYLEAGGKLLLMRERTDLFASDHGREFLAQLVGEGKREPMAQVGIRLPDHPWVKHLGAEQELPWLADRKATLLATSRGEAILGTDSGAAALYHLPVGKGEFVYVGWSPAASIPHGRLKSTVEEEQAFEEQMRIVTNIIGNLSGNP